MGTDEIAMSASLKCLSDTFFSAPTNCTQRFQFRHEQHQCAQEQDKILDRYKNLENTGICQTLPPRTRNKRLLVATRTFGFQFEIKFTKLKESSTEA